MATRTVFYSFHYQEDAWRVQQIRQINALEGQPILNSQDWEAVKRQGDQAIMNWIDQQMAYKRAVVVLVGGRQPVAHGCSMKLRNHGEKRNLLWAYASTDFQTTTVIRPLQVLIRSSKF